MQVLGWAGRRSLQFMDPEVEDEFVGKDFSRMLFTHQSLTSLELVMFFVSFTPIAKDTGQLLPLLGTLAVLQLYVRAQLARLKDQRRASELFCYAMYIFTGLQWLLAIYADQTFGYSVISDSTVMLILFFVLVVLQGTTCASAMSYHVENVPQVYTIFASVSATHVWLHEPPPGRTLQCQKSEFFGIYIFIVTICAVFGYVQVHARRLHMAELAGLAEHYQRQRDRLQYENVYSRASRPMDTFRKRGGSSEAGSEKTVSFTGLHEEHASACGSNSELGGRPPSTYGTNSELDGAADEIMEVKEWHMSMSRNVKADPDSTGSSSRSSFRHAKAMSDGGDVDDRLAPTSQVARDREKALWATLEQVGIIPKEHVD